METPKVSGSQILMSFIAAEIVGERYAKRIEELAIRLYCVVSPPFLRFQAALMQL